MNIILDERLITCADFVRSGSTFADIGTDHAYLPAYLISKGKIKSALACDVNKKPLESASATIRDYCVENIELRLCDGLSGVGENEFDDLCIAGMGGELIIKILAECKYIKNDRYRLILQPMSKAYDLRKWLCENGFEIEDEKGAVSKGKIYTVMCVRFSNKAKQYSEAFYYFGKLLEKSDEKSLIYKNKIKKSIEKKAKGILSADKSNQEALSLLALLKQIDKEK